VPQSIYSTTGLFFCLLMERGHGNGTVKILGRLSPK
jgi:hypothetical protein